MTTPAPAELAASIQSAWANFLTRDTRTSSPHRYVYASSWRRCDRRMVLDMVQPDQLPPFPAEVLAKFRRGDDRERDLLADLHRIGRDADPSFRVIGQQERFELRDRKGRVAITGKVDARLLIAGASAPLEVKAWAPQIVDRIDTFDDLFENTWTRSGGYQLLSYLYGAAQPFGFLLLDRSGLPSLLPVELDAHLDRVEEFLTRAERAVDHVEAGTLPDFLEGDAAECQRCPWYGQTCNPPLASAGAVVLTDPELEADLERREQLKPAGDEYNRLDARIKRQLRGIEQGIAGHFQITGRWGKHSHLELPEDLKRQYTISNPKGKFTLEITRL
jgi:hypothetical protein